MFNEPSVTGDSNEILRAIRQVRNRWRLRVALRGVAVLIAAALEVDHDIVSREHSGLI